ncbi:Geranylgeranyl/isoprenyl reductase [hydrothermal vent metagenome]|uniref:Geranylgeranyl/isoprenyl reductase n=1 Tax=hydrothermal vent metagenome TaxID=652676 RepID=A0A3B0RCD3_9ZZZZ
MLGKGQTLEFTALIGTDGVNSMVAKALYGRAFNPGKIGFALEIEAQSTSPVDESSALRIDFDAAAWGYGWQFPKRAGHTIGICGLQACNPDMKAHLTAYPERLGQGENARVKGHFLPFGDFRRKPGRGNILLVGDAAGLVDPITGEGIAYALQSGRMAALAVHRAISGGHA